MFKFLAIAAIVVAVEAIEYGHSGGYQGQDYYVEPHYSFAYEVKDSHTGDIKSHKEERKGEHTQGVYTLIEPDGSQRVVEYLVEGKSGFNAKVQRDHSQHSYQSGGYGQQSGGYGQQSGGYGQQSGVYGQQSGGYSHQSGGHGRQLDLSSHGYGGHALSSSNSYQSHGSSGYSSQGGYSSNGLESSHGGYSQSYTSHGGLKGGYKADLGTNLHGGYRSAPSYGSGDATSSVQFATHGAKIYTSTKHIIPQKHNY